MIDEVRDYWNRRPCNIMHSLVNIDEDPLLFSQQVTERKYTVESHIPGFAQFNRWVGKRVLELGCGIGTDTIEFARAGAQVDAIDISENSLAIARQRAVAEGVVPSISFFVADAERLAGFKGWPPDEYDLVYSFGVLHHTPNPEWALTSIKHYMRLDSELRITLYHRRSWKVFTVLLHNWRQVLQRKTVDQIVAMGSEAQSGCPVTWTFTKKSARALLESCGFEVESVEAAHIFPYHISDYVNHVYVKRWFWRALPQKVLHWLERRIGWRLLIVARDTSDLGGRKNNDN